MVPSAASTGDSAGAAAYARLRRSTLPLLRSVNRPFDAGCGSEDVRELVAVHASANAWALLAGVSR